MKVLSDNSRFNPENAAVADEVWKFNEEIIVEDDKDE
jgi:hypothetical protein